MARETFVKRLAVLLLFVLPACGVDGPPLPPEDAVPEIAQGGVSVVNTPEGF
ncbi:MAG: argininosuccinate lyase [Pseudomonadota bacterium]